MKRNDLGLVNKVVKKYSGIDLDKKAGELYYDFSNVNDALESVRRYFEDRGYKIFEWWNVDIPPKHDREDNVVEIVKNESGKGTRELKNFGVNINYKRLRNVQASLKRFNLVYNVRFFIGFSYFQELDPNKEPYWWTSSPELSQNKELANRWPEVAKGGRSDTPFDIEVLEFIVDFVNSLKTPKKHKDLIVENHSLGLVKKVKETQNSKGIEQVTEGMLELHSIEEAIDFIKTYARARGFNDIYEGYAFKVANDDLARKVYIIRSKEKQEATLKIKTSSGPSYTYTTGKETYVEISFGHIFRSISTPSPEDHIWCWNRTSDGRLKEHLMMADIKDIFSMAEDIISEKSQKLRENLNNLGLGAKAVKKYKNSAEDVIDEFMKEEIKRIYIERINDALYGDMDHAEFGFQCDEMDEKEIEGGKYPGCMLWTINEMNMYIHSTMLADVNGYLKCIYVHWVEVDKKGTGSFLIEREDLPKDILEEIDRNIEVVPDYKFS